MENIAIYGAGGFGRETALMITQINAAEPRWNLVGFFDDGKEKGDTVDGLPVLGGIGDINASREPLNLVLCVADCAVRRTLKGKITNHRIGFPSLIHPTALRGSETYNSIDNGTIITAGVILTTNVHIGAFVIVNLATTIGHDVTIGSFSTLMPSASISGHVEMGEEVLIGSGAVILPGLRVGSKAKVGAGAVVLSDVDEGQTVVGVPARGV